jgi:O-antigen/teichoic acid export membrane protein
VKKNRIDSGRKIDRLATESAILRSLSLVSTVVSLVATPAVFIHYSNISSLGLWTLVLSVGSFAAILDLGLIQVMTTASIQAFAKDKAGDARNILNILLNFLIYLVIFIFLALLILQLVLGSIWIISEQNFLQLLALCFFKYSLGLLVRYYEGAFRALGKLLGLKFLVVSSYADLAILLSNIISDGTFTLILLEMITTKAILILTLTFKFQKAFNIFKFISPKSAFTGISAYQKMGMSFLGMPLGYMALNEASNVVVGSFLGLEMLGIFAILKSLGGIFRQVSGIFLLSMTPKFTELISMEMFEVAQKAFFRMKILLIVLNSLILIFLLSAFNLASQHISKLESVGFGTYAIFLASAYLDIWWIIESSIMIAANQYEGLTLRFLCSSVVGCVIGSALLFRFGVSGMAIATLVIDFVLIPYSIKVGQRILKADFVK